LALLLTLSVIPAPAFPLDGVAVLELANDPGFTERYAGNTQVNGQFLSGLAIAGGASTHAFTDLKLALTGLSSSYVMPATVCVRVTTDDGRYWAANMYRATERFASPPKVPVPTRYAEQLNIYGSDNLLLLATLADNCNEASGKVYVPAIIGTAGKPAALLAYVNISQGRVLADLRGDNEKVLEKGSCKKPADGPRVTYSHICQISLSDSTRGQTLQLVIGVKGLTGQTAEQRYAVHVE